MIVLVFGLIIFLGVHSISIFKRSWRDAMVAKMGEQPFKGAYSLVSLLGFGLIVWGYGLARLEPVVLFVPPAGLKHVSLLLLLPIFPLLLATYFQGKIKAVLKHPTLVSVKLWALAHLLANGMLADVVLFGSFLVWAVVDRISVKRRPLAANTGVDASFNRNDIIALVGGVGLYVVFAFWLHALLIGVAPVSR